MTETNSTERTRLDVAMDVVLRSGHVLFSLAIVALGIQPFVCPNLLQGSFIEANRFGTVIGPIIAACGAGLLFKRTMRTAAMALGSLLVLYTLVNEVPLYVATPGSMGLRTVMLEPLAIAALAWLLPGQDAIPNWLARTSRYVLALCFIVFGVDHFLALAFIGTFMPPWIPWHMFWAVFFGAAFIAAGLSIGFNVLLRWGAACTGLMFAIWLFTIHLPRTLLGSYGGSGPHNADEWSGVFIVTALWGGSWAMAMPSRVYASGCMLLNSEWVDRRTHLNSSLQQLNIVSSNMQSSLEFYRLLGAEIPDSSVWHTPTGIHHASTKSQEIGAVFELDSVPFAQTWNSGWQGRSNLGGRVVLSFQVSSRKAVDMLYKQMIDAGYTGLQAPHDAFWGARYALIEDPDGIAVGVASPVCPKLRSTPPEV